MTTTESMYNSRIREKSFVKHFKKGACSGEETAALPVLQPWGLTSAAPQLESKCNIGRDSSPSAFMQFPWSHALCKLRLLIGRMVDQHFFFFLKKISTVKVVSWEPEEVRPIPQIWKKVIFLWHLNSILTHTHKINLWVGCLNSPAGERNTG